MRVTPLVFIHLAIAVLAVAVPGSGSSPAYAAKRVVPCAFPDGWNPTDFHRQQMQLTPDLHHFCQVDVRGHAVDKAGRPTS